MQPTPRRRERHGRGLRGPLSGPNPFTTTPIRFPRRSVGAEYFGWCLHNSWGRLGSRFPDLHAQITVGFEDVPQLGSGWVERVPLAAAASGPTGTRIVLFRRPIEHRATSRTELAQLIHRTLVEQIAAVSGYSVDDLDPDADTD